MSETAARDFDRLRGYYEQLRGQALALEEELGAALNSLDAVAALVRARRALEVIVTELCERDLHRPRGTDPLRNLLDRLAKDCPGLVPEGVLAAMRYLNELGNLGAHPNKPVSRRETEQAFQALAAVVEWYLLDYHRAAFAARAAGAAAGDPSASASATPGPLAGSAPATPASAPNPYVGLDSFEEKDANRFFGREALLDEVLWPAFAHLREQPPRLLALLGPSGSGKSSVARAGLLPRIQQDLGWPLLRLTPGHHPRNGS